MLFFRTTLVSCLALSQVVYAVYPEEELVIPPPPPLLRTAVSQPVVMPEVQQPSSDASEDSHITWVTSTRSLPPAPLSYSSSSSASQDASRKRKANDEPQHMDEGSQPPQKRARSESHGESSAPSLFPSTRGRVLTTVNKLFKATVKLVQADAKLSEGAIDEAKKTYEEVALNDSDRTYAKHTRHAAAIGLACALMESASPDYQRVWTLISEAVTFQETEKPAGHRKLPGQLYCFAKIYLGALCQMGYKDGVKGEPDFEAANQHYDKIPGHLRLFMHESDERTLKQNRELILQASGLVPIFITDPDSTFEDQHHQQVNDHPQHMDEGSQPAQKRTRSESHGESSAPSLFPSTRGRVLTTVNKRFKATVKLVQADAKLSEGAIDEAKKTYEEVALNNSDRTYAKHTRHAAAIGLACALMESASPDYQRVWTLISEAVTFQETEKPAGNRKLPGQLYCFAQICLGALCQMGYKDGVKGEPDFEAANQHYDKIPGHLRLFMHESDERTLKQNRELILQASSLVLTFRTDPIPMAENGPQQHENDQQRSSFLVPDSFSVRLSSEPTDVARVDSDRSHSSSSASISVHMRSDAGNGNANLLDRDLFTDFRSAVDGSPLNAIQHTDPGCFVSSDGMIRTEYGFKL